MITAQRQLFYFVGDKPFASLEEAQKADLMEIFTGLDGKFGEDVWPTVVDALLKNSKAIVDTLTTTPRSRLRARKLHGAKRAKQKPKFKPLTEDAKATA